MRQALLAMWKRPTTKIGIAAALMFQLIFSVVWMTGYDGITDRTERLSVGLVNEDPQMGAIVTGSLQGQLPFEVRELTSLAEAERQLEARELHMVVRIPADFTAKAASAEGAAALAYTINESNPSLIKSMMTAAAEQITAAVNKQAIAGGAQQVLSGQLQVPEQQAAAIAAMLSERVTSTITYMNPVDGVNNQMVPMMIVLASYVGAMIMGMNLEQSNMAAAAAGHGRRQRFGAWAFINVIASVVVSFVGVSLVAALGGQSSSSFLVLWGFEALFVLTFMFVAQLFLILFGLGGMLFNITLLSAQLVSSGAMMPRELLPDFYQTISAWFPATYAVEGAMNLLFGGPGIADAVSGLLAILAVSLVLGVAGTALRKRAIMPKQAGAPAAKTG